MDGQNDEHDPLDEESPPNPKRDHSGRFPKGVSGNPRGRKMQFKRDPSLPAAKRRIISAVADEEIDVKVGGKVRRMTLFEANVRSLAIDGTKNRVAAQRFIELATENSERDLERRLATHLLRERLDHAEAQNAQLKKKLGQDSPVVVLGAEEFDKWNANRRLDDDDELADVLPKPS